MNRKTAIYLFVAVIAVCSVFFAVRTLTAQYHAAIPTTDYIGVNDSKKISVELLFTRPLLGDIVSMEKPKRCGGSIAGGEIDDLMPSLKEFKFKGISKWRADYEIKKPGAHVFFTETSPTWIPKEDLFTVDNVKVVVGAMGDDTGWDRELGLKTEIIPLARSYGLLKGHLFSGIVKIDGKPVPYATVKIVHYAKKKKKDPTPAHAFQVVKSDGNGVFHYAMVKAGWWLYYTRTPAGYTLKSPEGKEKEVRFGAALWVGTYGCGKESKGNPDTGY